MGDQCPPKPLVPGAQRRERVIISQVVAYCAASREEGGVVGVPVAAWPGRTVCRATHGARAAWVAPMFPTPLCMTVLGRCSLRPIVECSPAYLTVVPSVLYAILGRHTCSDSSETRVNHPVVSRAET